MTQAQPVAIGVGLDTARYGHHASFLREDLQPATNSFHFVESGEGYQRFEAALRKLADRHGGNVHFHIRIDAAGQYAANLEAFLRRLDLSTTISVGQPKANKDYKSVHFPKRKADAVDSLACARFAIVERPKQTPAAPPAFAQLRDLAGALAFARKDTTRRVNRLHNHLARVFPELAKIARDIDANWVLALLKKYPTPRRIAAARSSSLTKIPHLGAERAESIKAAAQNSVASLAGPMADAMIRELVAAVRQAQENEERLGKLLERAFRKLPPGGHRQLETIPGIGIRTAAALTAKMVSIDRFDTPESLVGYFGVFAEEYDTGVDKAGNPIRRKSSSMSRKGNDLVRGLLWMAAKSATNCNPAVSALYARQRAAGKRGDVALGHCMRKLLQLAWAVWKTDRPFDPEHHPWEHPSVDDNDQTAQKTAAGRNGRLPGSKAVTAAANQLATRSIPPNAEAGKTAGVDFAHVRRQVRMLDLLKHLGIADRLKGTGPQRRGPCPIHEPDRTAGRSFSVNLEKQVFRCLHPDCAAKGNVLDLWALLHRLGLLDAAKQLAETFNVDLKENYQ